jgi:hypothetical protein
VKGGTPKDIKIPWFLIMFINFPGQNARTWGRSLGGSPQLVSGAMTPVVTGLTPLTLLTSGVNKPLTNCDEPPTGEYE